MNKLNPLEVLRKNFQAVAELGCAAIDAAFSDEEELKEKILTEFQKMRAKVERPCESEEDLLQGRLF